MKKILLRACLFLACATINAQVTYTLDTLTNVDSLIAPLNKESFTSGVLYDRVVPIANLTSFNTATNNVSSLPHFEQALYELYRAAKKTKFNSVANARKAYVSLARKNKVDIGIINAQLHRLNFNAENNQLGALKLTNKTLTPINDKALFLEKDLLLIAPLKKLAIGQEITYAFKEDLFFEESSKKIVTLTAQFDGQGSHTIIQNSQFINKEVAIGYATTGPKTLTFTATYTNGSQTTTKGSLYVSVASANAMRNPDEGIEDGNITATLPFTGYEPGDLPILGQLEYRIFYHGTPNNYERILKKPIVIIDGFDPFDRRKIQDSDNLDPDLSEEEHISIEDLMTYKDNFGDSESLIGKLRALGYDVVIVNHPIYEDVATGKTIDGGADYIERNAMAHIALYQYLNQSIYNNGSNEQLTIMGPSMGGQISRYALAYMEEHNLEHNTKLWVSIDSPHLGANIPMGAQSNIYFLGYVYGDQIAKDQYDFLLNSPAGKQQLLLQFSNANTNLPPYFQQYHSNLEANLPSFKGFPQLPRKVAISNGSLNKGINSPAQKVLDIRGFKDFLGMSVKGFQNEQWFLKNTGQQKKIFYGMFKELDSGWIYASLTTTEMTTRFTNPLVYGALDAVQGGMADSHGDIKIEIEKNLEKLINNGDLDRMSLRTYIPNHSFVPTVSALAFKNPNFNWRNNIDRDLTCTNEIPFDTYYAPIDNEVHVSFTQESVNWLFQELAGNHQPASVRKEFTHSSLSGDIAVCDNKTNTYTLDIPDSCSGYTVIWSTSDNIEIYASTNNSVNVRLLRDATSPIGFVSAYIKEIDQWLTNIVWVGIPSPDFLRIQKLGSYGFYSNQWTKLKVVHPIPASEFMAEDPGYGLSYQWLVPNSQVRTFTDTSTIDVNPNSSGQLNVGVKMQNPCGCTEYQYQLFDVQRPEGAGSNGGGILTPVGQN